MQNWAGSSPRGRGTLLDAVPEARKHRFIPAWAGNTKARLLAAAQAAVHPRVGGEHFLLGFADGFGGGSSPRGRGTQDDPQEHQHQQRFIPAWAGNTANHVLIRTAFSVHPRVGGEHRENGARAVGNYGSSPRGRGTPLDRGKRRRCRRFIPAWAGNTAARPITRAARSVHPRVGGEHSSRPTKKSRKSGSSPRGRGTLSTNEKNAIGVRFIPAWAGNTHWQATSLKPTGGSSPRGRGTRVFHDRWPDQHRFIPAWAGNT